MALRLTLTAIPINHAIGSALTGMEWGYRNIDQDWEDLADYDGAPITQPALFFGGDRDASIAWNQQAIDAFPTSLPSLSGTHLLQGCGHWVQQERPDQVNALLIDWLRKVHTK